MHRSVVALVVSIFGLSAAIAPAHAGLAPTATQDILSAATSPADLRARLAAYARGAEAKDPIGAGEAWSCAGLSYSRASLPDSAIDSWRRALDLRGTHEDRYQLAEALLTRQAPGDVEEGARIASGALAEAQGEAPQAAVWYQALLAWSKLLAGDRESALGLFAAIEEPISKEPVWRFRYARSLLDSDDPRKAIRLLMPLAVASRGEDRAVMGLLELATQRIQQPGTLASAVDDQIRQRDAIETRVVTRMAGRRIKFAARDGFALSGVLIEAAGAKRRLAVVLVAPEDTLADFDSLAAALRVSGLHTLLLNVRGTGWSVNAACPLAGSWRGREEAMHRVTARDVRDAVRAVAMVNRCDTNGVVLVASRSLALAGALAAAQDRHIKALVLLSPDPSPVDRGLVATTLAARRIPVFLQQTPEDYPNFEFIDLAYHATAEARSRVSDGRAGGHGASAFRQDPRVTPRFVQWLAEALKAPAAPAPRPKSPRQG